MQNLNFNFKIVDSVDGPIAGFTYMDLTVLLDYLDRERECNWGLITLLEGIKGKMIEHDKKS